MSFFRHDCSLLLDQTIFNYAGVHIPTVCGQDTCGTVGTNLGEQNANRDLSFYLNTQHPAACDGNITSFRYCNYHPNAFALAFRSTFAIYRPLGDGSYQAVSEAFTVGGGGDALNLGEFNRDEFRFQNDFGCGLRMVNVPIAVQVGDVIGACMYDPGFLVAQLDIVGSIQDNSRFLLLTGNTGCADNAVPSSVNSLTQTDSLVLHVDADIGRVTKIVAYFLFDSIVCVPYLYY